MSGAWVDCTTQAEFDAAIAAGDVPVVSEGYWTASDSASVTGSDSASVRAFGSASVTAFGSASVRAYDSASVRAYGSASVRAYDSASVTAFGSASVTAFGSASVRAYGSASVRAFGSASVRAGSNVPIHDHGPNVTIAGGIPISVRRITDPKAWCEFHGLIVTRGKVTVYKAVEDDWRGGTKHESITYRPGDKPEAHDWQPTDACGAGLHFVPRPWEGDRYLDKPAAHYVACVVRLSEMVVLDDKCKARRVVAPIVECDLDGNPTEATS